MCRTGAWIGWRRLGWNLAPLPNREKMEDGKRSSVGGSIAIVSDGPRRTSAGRVGSDVRRETGGV